MNSEYLNFPQSAIDSPLEQYCGYESSDLAGGREHTVSFIPHGDSALIARIHLIRAAKRTIDIQTFIWADDESGFFLARELYWAAKRGVEVRLLVDHWVASIDESPKESVLQKLSASHPNCQVRLFNPLGENFQTSVWDIARNLVSRFAEANVRMHNKLMVVDGVYGLTGGRNVENDYFDRGSTRNFLDADLLCIGPEVRKMSAGFGVFWSNEVSKSISLIEDTREALNISFEDPIESFECLPTVSFTEAVETAIDPKRLRETRVFDIQNVSDLQFVMDRPPKCEGQGEQCGPGHCAYELKTLLASARKEVLIQSPYLVVDEWMGTAIEELVAVRPTVRLLASTNSLASTDNLIAYAAAQSERKSQIEDYRFEIFELKPVPPAIREFLPRYDALMESSDLPPSAVQADEENGFEIQTVHLALHNKLYCIDGSACLIGSFNFDPRSLHHNTECFVLIKDHDFSQIVRNRILDICRPENSWTVGVRRAPKKRASLAEPVKTLLGGTLKGFWPYGYASCFEFCADSKCTVPCFDEQFYERYEDVGPFPEVDVDEKQIEAELAQVFGSFVRKFV